jgi:hypothetical protein
VAGIVATTSPASAQLEHLAGGYIVSSFPTGDWGEIAGFGLALDGTDVIRMGPEKPLAWRLSSGLLYNFSRTVDVPQSNVGANDRLELETKNWSILFGFGPEFGKRTGPVMPFVYGTVGFDTYWTSSTLQGTVGGSAYEAEHGDSRLSFAWAAGVGVRRRVSEGVLGEFSVEYRSGSDHRFLLPSEVTASGGNVVADRASRVSDQILVRLGTVFAQ